MKKNVIRLLMSLVAILTANTMLAENKLWIASEGDGKFAIMMDCDANAAAFQFNLEVPKELKVLKVNSEGRDSYVYRNPERFSNGQNLRCSDPRPQADGSNLFVVMAVSMQKESFIGENGTPVAYFQTELNPNYTSWTKENLKLTDIIFSTGNGTQLPADETSVYDGAVYGELAAYFEIGKLAVKPGQQNVKVPVALKNSFPVSALQMNITLPEGFTLSNEFEHTSRVATTAQINMKHHEDNNSYTLLMADIIDNMSIPQASDGTIFYCFLNVPDNYDAASTTILLNGVIGSTKEGQAIKGVGTSTIKVVEDTRDAENEAARDAVLAQIKTLQDKLDAAKEEVAEKLPDYVPTANIEAAQQLIDDATKAANDALDAVKESGVYGYTLDEAPILAAIAEIRPAANLAAYNADKEAVETLFENYRKTVTEIQSDYKEYEDLGAENLVKTNIEAAERAINKAYTNVATEGYYASPIDAQALQASIDKLLENAKAGKAEAQRKADNKAAYEADLNKLAELNAEYIDVISEIAEKYVDFRNEAAENAVKLKLDNAEKAIERAYKAVEAAGNYVTPAEFNYYELKAAIEKLLTDAEQAKADKDAADAAAEEQRKADNKAAYEAALAEIQAVQEYFDGIVAEIKKDYAEYEDVTAEADVQAQINDTKKGADAAYEAVAAEGKFNFTVPTETLKAAADALLDAAKALKKAADDKAEQERLAANKAAYEAALAEVDALQTALDNMIEKVAETYPDFVDADANAAVQGMIDAIRDAVVKEYQDTMTEGTFSYTVDGTAVNAAIQALFDSAKAAADKAAADAEAARQEANKAAYEAALAQIAEIEKYYDDTVAAIAENLADYADADAEAAVKAQIEAAKADAEAAYKAVATEGTFDYTVPAETLIDAIAKLLADAQAKADAAAEADRQAKNEAAYNAALAQLQEAQDYFDAIVAEIKANYADGEDVDAENAVQAEIDNVKSAIEAAYAAVANEGIFDYTVPVDALKAAADELLANAKVAADAAAEEKRKADNKEAYEAALAQLQEVQDYLDEMVAKIKAEYPDYDVDADAAEVQVEIDNVKGAIEVAYELVANEGTFSYKVPVSSLKASVDGLLEKAVASGVDGIEADEAETFYFTTDGKRHSNPVHGEINIVVRKNGQTSKMYVK